MRDHQVECAGGMGPCGIVMSGVRKGWGDVGSLCGACGGDRALLDCQCECGRDGAVRDDQGGVQKGRGLAGWSMARAEEFGRSGIINVIA